MAIEKFDPQTLEQLTLNLDLPEPPENVGVSQEEIQRASMAAMQAFEKNSPLAPRMQGEKVSVEGEVSAWFSDYLRLKELGYDWRLAAYIAWESSPKVDRWPGTLDELAKEVLGLASPRVIYTWRKKNPDIDSVISMMQSAPLYAHRRDVIEALIKVATDPDYKGHQDRKLFFEMIRDYTPRKEVDVNDKRAPKDDLSALSDEELAARAAALKDSAPPNPPQAGGEKVSSSHSANAPGASDLDLGPSSTDGEVESGPTPPSASGASDLDLGPSSTEGEVESGPTPPSASGASDLDLGPSSTEGEVDPRD